MSALKFAAITPVVIAGTLAYLVYAGAGQYLWLIPGTVVLFLILKLAIRPGSKTSPAE